MEPRAVSIINAADEITDQETDRCPTRERILDHDSELATAKFDCIYIFNFQQTITKLTTLNKSLLRELPYYGQNFILAWPIQ